MGMVDAVQVFMVWWLSGLWLRGLCVGVGRRGGMRGRLGVVLGFVVGSRLREGSGVRCAVCGVRCGRDGWRREEVVCLC